jgi:1,4-dihydroxy-2-naphthoate octaprenyltransferase
MLLFCTYGYRLSPRPELWRALLTFFILHFLLYPASNAYNSYYDKDEDSIGGLEKPPPVNTQLLYAALVLDAAALVLGIFLGWPMIVGLLLYGTVSKAYSHEKIRLKKYPVISWVLASVFQGAVTFLMTYQAISNLPIADLGQPYVLTPALLTTTLLAGSYPMTQIYQHAEDARRGDMTLSRLLGIRGTFVFTAIVFSITVAGFYWYFTTYHFARCFYIFLLFLSPALVYFFWWYARVHRELSAANFRATMRLNTLTATGMNGFFVVFAFLIR